MVSGDRPVAKSVMGFSFVLRIDEITPIFSGLPVLGFTRLKLVDEPDYFQLYPIA